MAEGLTLAAVVDACLRWCGKGDVADRLILLVSPLSVSRRWWAVETRRGWWLVQGERPQPWGQLPEGAEGPFGSEQEAEGRFEELQNETG